MLKILTALKDIPGVVGSFVLADQGALLCREMPAIYPDELFSELARRLVGVKEAVETQASPFSDLLLKFDAFWIVSRRASQCTLSILTTQSVNYPALRMATNVALKRIEEKIASGEVTLTAPAAPAAPEAPKARRYFRGQAVG
jgi:predicted regulator of Ras-like GTPase activity (Roadblock/LC7/MglB family)